MLIKDRYVSLFLRFLGDISGQKLWLFLDTRAKQIFFCVYYITKHINNTTKEVLFHQFLIFELVNFKIGIICLVF